MRWMVAALAFAMMLMGLENLQAQDAGLRGSYTRETTPTVTLTIDAKSLTATNGTVTFTAPYTVKNVAQDQVLIEFQPVGHQDTYKLQVTKSGTTLRISGSGAFSGTWIRN